MNRHLANVLISLLAVAGVFAAAAAWPVVWSWFVAYGNFLLAHHGPAVDAAAFAGPPAAAVLLVTAWVLRPRALRPSHLVRRVGSREVSR